MADSPKRTVSPWWGLVLLPIPLVLGWFIADLPAPPPRAHEAAAPAAMESPARPAPSAHVRAHSESPAPAPEPEARREEELRWMSLTGATYESKRSGRPILLDFNAEWCGPCRNLKRTVFDDPAHSRAIGALVIGVSVVDRNREEGSNPQETEELQQHYRIEGFPTLIVYSPSTGRSERRVGFSDPAATEQWIAWAAGSVR